MTRTRMWTTIHPVEETGPQMWLTATDGTERVFARIEWDHENGPFFRGVRMSDGKEYTGFNDPFELMHTLFVATVGDVGKELE